MENFCVSVPLGRKVGNLESMHTWKTSVCWTQDSTLPVFIFSLFSIIFTLVTWSMLLHGCFHLWKCLCKFLALVASSSFWATGISYSSQGHVGITRALNCKAWLCVIQGLKSLHWCNLPPWSENSCLLVVTMGLRFCLSWTKCQVFAALLHQRFLMSLRAHKTASTIFLFAFALK